MAEPAPGTIQDGNAADPAGLNTDDSLSPLPAPIVVNVGCGPRAGERLPAWFHGWRQLRIDVDISVQPDVVADITDLSQLADGTADAVWASHCLEHLYAHEVRTALGEFRRILKPGGFACITVPDIQTVAHYAAADRLHEIIYESKAGPVTAHDIFFGHGAAIASGRSSMAHRCGFTPGVLVEHFRAVPFAEVVLKRRPASLEIMALCRMRPSHDDNEREALIAALES